MPLDYRKWDHIEVSDDEDETIPNVDTPSLFKWRHDARVHKMKEIKNKTESVEAEKRKIEAKLKEVKERVKREEEAGGDNLEDLKRSLTDIEKEMESVSIKEAEVLKEKKSMPHNVDTLSSDGFSKTIVNKTVNPKDEVLSEEEKEKRMKKFVKDNEKLIKEYGMLQKFEDSKKFLMNGRTHLASEETYNYLLLWCLDLEMEGEKRTLIE